MTCRNFKRPGRVEFKRAHDGARTSNIRVVRLTQETDLTLPPPTDYFLPRK